MLKIRGTKLYPAAVMDAVRAFDGVEAFILIADTDEHGSDQLCVRVAMLPEYRRPSVECELQEALRGRLRVRVQVETAPKEEILAQAHRPGYRKRVMFVDRRKRSERMEAEHEENT
jgi:phenylacetate-coenzyme A ligase PaaK-like adenylate-forming protein